MLKTLALLMNRFKLDWKVMQAVMLTTGAVISGSAALSVLHVGEFVPQDLVIVVGNPWVFLTNPYPYPPKPIPMVVGMGFGGYGYGF